MPTTAPRVDLDHVRVASPCHESWAGMTGDDRVRFCGRCRLNVYNLSAMTREEAQALVGAKEGRRCIRFFRRPDGTLLTRDCPYGWRAIRRRLAWIGGCAAAVLALAAGALSTMSSPSSGRKPSLRDALARLFYPSKPNVLATLGVGVVEVGPENQR
ncbi:MAG: hypothetical protein HYZ53_28105 [Planctomycetes bacterium]|nr:hypothetical protein [Planctomycetota bacterium]